MVAILGLLAVLAIVAGVVALRTAIFSLWYCFDDAFAAAANVPAIGTVPLYVVFGIAVLTMFLFPARSAS